MQLIAVDIGNSSTKIAVTASGDDRRWCSEFVFRGNELSQSGPELLAISSPPAVWYTSSVNDTRRRQLEKWIARNRPDDQFHVITPEEISLESNIQSRSQLGRDRLIAAWMAVELNDQSGPVIVVDAGTAVTIDLVDKQKIFQGGFIFPGADSNFRQLEKHTNALPGLPQHNRIKSLKKLNVSNAGLFLGKETKSAILQGIYQSQIGAITQIVRELESRFPAPPVVYATGGGIAEIQELGRMVPQRLPETWNYVPDLVLRGVRAIGTQCLNRQSPGSNPSSAAK